MNVFTHNTQRNSKANKHFDGSLLLKVIRSHQLMAVLKLISTLHLLNFIGVKLRFYYSCFGVLI